jgi:hypothetical protein
MQDIKILTLYIATWQWFSLSFITFMFAVLLALLKFSLVAIFFVIVSLSYLTISFLRRRELNKVIGVKGE